MLLRPRYSLWGKKKYTYGLRWKQEPSSVDWNSEYQNEPINFPENTCLLVLPTEAPRINDIQ